MFSPPFKTFDLTNGLNTALQMYKLSTEKAQAKVFVKIPTRKSLDEKLNLISDLEAESINSSRKEQARVDTHFSEYPKRLRWNRQDRFGPEYFKSLE